MEWHHKQEKNELAVSYCFLPDLFSVFPTKYALVSHFHSSCYSDLLLLLLSYSIPSHPPPSSIDLILSSPYLESAFRGGGKCSRDVAKLSHIWLKKCVVVDIFWIAFLFVSAEIHSLFSLYSVFLPSKKQWNCVYRDIPFTTLVCSMDLPLEEVKPTEKSRRVTVFKTKEYKPRESLITWVRASEKCHFILFEIKHCARCWIF